jgi:hypothetical protein
MPLVESRIVVFLKPLVERCFMHFRLRGGTVRLQPSCEQVRSVNGTTSKLSMSSPMKQSASSVRLRAELGVEDGRVALVVDGVPDANARGSSYSTVQPSPGSFGQGPLAHVLLPRSSPFRSCGFVFPGAVGIGTHSSSSSTSFPSNRGVRRRLSERRPRRSSGSD